MPLQVVAQCFWSRKLLTGRPLKVTLPELLLTLVLLRVRCPSSAQRRSHLNNGRSAVISLRLSTHRSVTSRVSAVLMETELWTLSGFQLQSSVTNKDTGDKGPVRSRHMLNNGCLWCCFDPAEISICAKADQRFTATTKRFLDFSGRLIITIKSMKEGEDIKRT